MKKVLVTSLLFALVLTAMGPLAHGQQQANDEAAKTKAEVMRRADKNEERVKIKLRNGTEVKGRITQTEDNSFTLTDEKTGAKTDIDYTDVQKLNGRGMSKKMKVALVSSAVVGTFIAALAYAFAHLWD